MNEIDIKMGPLKLSRLNEQRRFYIKRTGVVSILLKFVVVGRKLPQNLGQLEYKLQSNCHNISRETSKARRDNLLEIYT